MAEQTEIRRPDRRPLTTSLRISTRPFLDVLGLLPPDNEFLPRDNVVLPPDYGFFESLRFFCPTIPRYSSDTHKPLSARRSPQLPPHSGLLPMRPTPNDPTLGKGNVPYCSNNGAFSIALTHSCREWMGIELGEKIRAGERVSLLARMARFLRQSVPLCVVLFLSPAVGQVPDRGEHFERRLSPVYLERCGECHGERCKKPV